MWKEAKGFNAEDLHNASDEKLGQYLKSKQTQFAPQYKMQPSWDQPQTSWMFEVDFFFTNEAKARYNLDDVSTDPTFMCVKADLPKFETKTKEFFFLGSKMTKAICRDYSGDSELQFWLRGNTNKLGQDDPSTNKKALLDVLAHKRIDTLQYDYTHPEFEPMFSFIWITLRTIDGRIYKRFVLENPVITNVDTGGSVSYDSEDGLKLSMTIHYDHWSVQG